MSEQAIRRVMVACPVTGKPIFTGQGMDSLEHLPSEGTFEVPRCDHCGQSHVVPAAAAFLEEEPSAQ
jgi:hypothetical protein